MNPVRPAESSLIRRAGLEPWPKTFQNLRSTRQTELAAKFPVHVVCNWLGNSKLIAQEHYLRVREDDFRKAVQNPVQQPAVAARNASQELNTETPENLCFQGSDAEQEWAVLDSNSAENAGENAVSDGGSAESSAVHDARLRKVLVAWPRLPEHLRVAIIAMVGG